MITTVANGWSNEGSWDLLPGGGVAKHQALPSVQPSFATEDAIKKQEPTNKKSQTHGL